MKLKYFVPLLVLAAFPLYAERHYLNDDFEYKPDVPPKEFWNMFEAKVAYYHFNSKPVREILNNGAAYYELSYTYLFDCKRLGIYSSLGYLYKFGHSIGGHNGNHLNFLPIRLGLQGFFNLNKWSKFYLIAGPQYGFVWIKNDSKFVDPHNVSSRLGGFAGLGFLFEFKDRWFVDIFGNYSYNRMEFHTSKLNVHALKTQFGGLTGGGGFGFRF